MARRKKDPFQVQLGERIRALRNRAGFTQERLAEKADVSVKFIGNIERGESAVSVRTLRRIAHALSVTLKELFDFPDEDAGEILDAIMGLLRGTECDVDELKGLMYMIRIAAHR